MRNAPAQFHTPDRLLRLPEVAKRLNVSKSWLYKHWRDFPFFMKVRGTALRASEAKLNAWMATQTGRQ